jgi:hypothetical protein
MICKVLNTSQAIRYERFSRLAPMASYVFTFQNFSFSQNDLFYIFSHVQVLKICKWINAVVLNLGITRLFLNSANQVDQLTNHFLSTRINEFIQKKNCKGCSTVKNPSIKVKSFG